MDFYSLNPMDYQWNLIPPIPGSFWMDIFELSFFLFLGHFELKLNECPQRHYAFPNFNSCLHCIRNVLIQQKLMRSFKYLDSLFCYLGKHFKDILESAIYQEAISAILLTCLYFSSSKLPPPVPFSTRLSSTVPPSPCLPLR